MKNAIRIAKYAGISWASLSALIYLIYGNQPDQLANVGELGALIGIIAGITWLSVDAPEDNASLN